METRPQISYFFESDQGECASVMTPSRRFPCLSIIVPTKNEAGNIAPLLTRIEQATSGIPTEVIFVDDSADETPQVIQEVCDHSALETTLIHRPPERRGNGLGGAVIEGLRAARAAWVCIMDADLQHPPELIPQLLETAKDSHADLVVASRNAPHSDASGLGVARAAISRALAGLARVFFPHGLREVTDPLTGFFLLRREAIDIERLHPRGFKILLEILIRFPKLRVVDVPLHFAKRYSGRSKASVREAIRYVSLLWHLRFGEDALHLAQFAFVGLTGLVVNSLVLVLATDYLQIFYLVSAAIATVCSTTWNFALTEWWVFGDRRQAQGRLKRFAVFSAVNVGALALRGPILYAFTSLLGLHYLISNFISIAGLMVLRFAFADAWIWRKRKAEQHLTASQSFPGLNPLQRRPERNKLNSYNIHDILTVVSDVALPELEKFRSHTAIERPTIRVRLGKVPRTPAGSSYVRYDEGWGPLGFKTQVKRGDTIEIIAAPVLKYSPHVLYTNIVEPVLRWEFVERGYALVHGACVAFNGKAYLVTARTDTGKTTTLLKMLSRQRRKSDSAAFLSDDLTLVAPTGSVLSYPKPMTISSHTVHAVNTATLSWGQRLALIAQSRVHSKKGRHIAHAMLKTKFPVATINTYAQLFVPPPKYHIEQLVPTAKLEGKARLAGMFIIERGDDAEILLDEPAALETLMENCEDAYGFPPYDAIKNFLTAPNGQDLQFEERHLVAQALHGLPTTLIRTQGREWSRRILVLVGEPPSERRVESPQPTLRRDSFGVLA